MHKNCEDGGEDGCEEGVEDDGKVEWLISSCLLGRVAIMTVN